MVNTEKLSMSDRIEKFRFDRAANKVAVILRKSRQLIAIRICVIHSVTCTLTRRPFLLQASVSRLRLIFPDFREIIAPQLRYSFTIWDLVYTIHNQKIDFNFTGSDEIIGPSAPLDEQQTNDMLQHILEGIPEPLITDYTKSDISLILSQMVISKRPDNKK